MLREFSKFILFLVLFIYLFIAAILLFMAVVVCLSFENINELNVECENCGLKLSSILLTVPILLFTIILSGFLGACRVKKPMNKFLFLFFILFFVEVTGGLLAYINRHELGNKVQKNMNITFSRYKEKEKVRKAIDHLQKKGQCCGINNPIDWLQYGFDEHNIPDSCCYSLPNVHNCSYDTLPLNIMGCYAKVNYVFTANKVLLFTLFGFFYIIQFLVLAFGLHVTCTIKTPASPQ